MQDSLCSVILFFLLLKKIHVFLEACYFLEQGSENYSPWAGKIKFYWNTATFIVLHMVCGCFPIKLAELSYCIRDCMGHKAENTQCLAF
jgi:hypothetical protein